MHNTTNTSTAGLPVSCERYDAQTVPVSYATGNRKTVQIRTCGDIFPEEPLGLSHNRVREDPVSCRALDDACEWLRRDSCASAERAPQRPAPKTPARWEGSRAADVFRTTRPCLHRLPVSLSPLVVLRVLPVGSPHHRTIPHVGRPSQRGLLIARVGVSVLPLPLAAAPSVRTPWRPMIISDIAASTIRSLRDS